MIHVAICLTDTSGHYHKHALVTAASVLDNTKSGLCLHLVHDETLSPAAEKAFHDLCVRHGQMLRLHHAREIPEEVEGNVLTFLGKGTLYKTMLPSLLLEDKVLYLDCDIICLCDVATVFQFDISGYFLGAVKKGQKQALVWCKKLGLRSDFCINAGVLLMNLDKIRRDIPDYTERLFGVVRGNGTRIGDQGATNIFFDGKPDAYVFLPEFCNFLMEQGDNFTLPMKDYQGKILHFAGQKPWEVFSAPSVFYWKYYAALFPEEDVFARMEALEPYEYAHLFSFMLRKEPVRRMVNRLCEVESTGFLHMAAKRLGRSMRRVVGRG